ncbi:hypothetical protein [Luteolibacter sp. LG18]|uniref:hypothetical protein n=1 Tax=Luteolibacter sp. LG18 TaxID=2819286 RepID=UPI002B2EC3FF|nr:hypothetical protein llg_20070 [Luteolibacter sp. LG18]
MRAVVLGVVLAAAGCNKPRPGGSMAIVPAAVREPDYHPGDLDAAGKLVFWTVDAFDHQAPFILRGECGVVLANAGNETHPRPRFIFARQSTREIVDTEDPAVFRAVLAKVPAGTAVLRYETCSVPRCFGLSEGQVGDFTQAITDAGLALESEVETVCYCPDHG